LLFFKKKTKVVKAVHLHWRLFSYQGQSYLPGINKHFQYFDRIFFGCNFFFPLVVSFVFFCLGKVTFVVTPDTASGTATIAAGAAPANLTLAFLANPTLSAAAFYLNVHGSWSPSSPQGSMAGIVTR
jgi:hypothetical protein